MGWFDENAPFPAAPGAQARRRVGGDPTADDWFAQQGAPGGGPSGGGAPVNTAPGSAAPRPIYPGGAPGGGGGFTEADPNIPGAGRTVKPDGSLWVWGDFSPIHQVSPPGTYDPKTGQPVNGSAPAPGTPPGGGGSPAPGGAPASGDPGAFGRAWLASGGQTPADLEAFVAAHPEYGAEIFGSKGDKVRIGGRAYDAVLSAGAGGRGASWNYLDPTARGGGGGGGGRIGEGLENTPGYQFRLQQGLQALERSAAARGTLLTGGTLKGLQRYAQDVASGEYGNRVNQLMDLSRLGLAGASGSANVGSAYAGQAGNLYSDQAQQNTNLTTGQGNAQAAGTVAGGNAWANALGQGGNSILQMYLLSRMFGSGGGGVTPAQQAYWNAGQTGPVLG